MRCEHHLLAFDPRFTGCDYITEDAFNIEFCSKCGVSFTNPIPSLEGMERYYPKAYYGEVSSRRFPWWVEILQKRLYSSRVGVFSARVIPGSVIDIGCGKGFLLNEFKQRGWKVQGVELSEWAARHAREKFGIEVHVGALSSAPIEPGTMDAAVLWHVLEHTDQPGEVLSEANRLLKPGGYLLLGVPNWGSPEARISKSRWFHLDVPRHLAHFTEKSLGKLLESNGFEVIKRFCFAPEFDLFSFVQSLLNMLGLPPNHLYRNLRGQGAKLKHPRDRFWHIPLSFGLAIPLTVIGTPWIFLAGLFGWGSSLTYLVRKNNNSFESVQTP